MTEKEKEEKSPQERERERERNQQWFLVAANGWANYP
jgi:hypothetical protein